MATKVLLADDHVVFCEALAAVLGLEADLQVVGQAHDGASSVRLALELSPDVVLMDVHMPNGDGLEATASIKAGRPQTRVVMLTSDEEEESLRRALDLGASGYLTKREASAEVVRAVRAAAAGEMLVPPLMLARLLRQMSGPPAVPRADLHLTPRELEVLGALAQGMNGMQIARRLSMSPNTVRTHVQNILGKLGVHSKLEAVTKAVREGWVKVA